MKITLDLPADVFDDGFSEDAFAERMRQWAILALVDAHRLHEHEAARMLGLERWELVERMEAQGIRPTEQVFEEIRAQLTGAIAAHAAAPQQGRTTMRFLHTMIRVNDLDHSLKFYCGPLGMKLLSRKDYPDGKFTLAFVGYGDENANTVVELTHNWDTKSYDARHRLRPSRDRRRRHLQDLRRTQARGREGHARARTDEIRLHGDRVCRGSQRLQD